MKKIITNSEKETLDFAKSIGQKLKTKTIFALEGDLGAGKTTFTKGLARGLGVKKTVTSPTFVLMKVYPVRQNKYIKELCHIDAYRLKSTIDLEAIGALEYFQKPGTVTVIEWSEKIKKLLPKRIKAIKFKHQEEDKRQIEIK